MSVYTSLDEDDVASLLRKYTVGSLVSYQGILAGIENTNYFVTTGKDEFVLTLFESVPEKELPFFLDYMAYLNEHDIPCPHPVADNQGNYIQHIKQKPAALLQKLTGAHVQSPNLAQCSSVGDLLGRMHRVSAEFQQTRNNPRDLQWCTVARQRLQTKLHAYDKALLESEMDFQLGYAREVLPQSVIHADLFKDNVLFTGDTLTGVIDFYYACNDAQLLDVAIAVNDWCMQDDFSLNTRLCDALLAAYSKQRPVTPRERELWPVMLRRAALRFWVSRLLDQYFPKSGELVYVKNPDVFKNILLTHAQA